MHKITFHVHYLPQGIFIAMCALLLRLTGDLVRRGQVHMMLDDFSRKFSICNNLALS